MDIRERFEPFFYEVLDAESPDSSDTIRKRYLQKVSTCHPDMPQGNQELFLQIQNAYEILSDSSNRKIYDSWLSNTKVSGNKVLPYEFDLDECDFDENTNEYIYKCRCAANVRFLDELDFTVVHYLRCQSCSVRFKLNPFEESESED